MKDVTRSTSTGEGAALAAAVVATTLTMLALDLAWLGVVAKDFYDQALAGLRSPEVYWPAAGTFYAFYVAAIVLYAVRGATGTAAAAKRGAGLGLVAYATYELTNWAVLRDWPARLVPVDLGWGIVLTALAALAGRWAYGKVLGR